MKAAEDVDISIQWEVLGPVQGTLGACQENELVKGRVEVSLQLWVVPMSECTNIALEASSRVLSCLTRSGLSGTSMPNQAWSSVMIA